ncbi:hypothetical protein GYMLUDRAFT_353897 [Collybiopsis luxurians FD-317 M1]|nr:hypothetical protein GYMLUDRAFT_353897 [Collybiopsis luxurians FD-317 M1]
MRADKRSAVSASFFFWSSSRGSVVSLGATWFPLSRRRSSGWPISISDMMFSQVFFEGQRIFLSLISASHVTYTNWREARGALPHQLRGSDIMARNTISLPCNDTGPPSGFSI